MFSRAGVRSEGGPPDHAARRAARLCRWYPKDWRARYGTEFSELLVAEFAEQPRSLRRTADVACSGLLARCASAGLRANPLDPPDQARASLAALCCAVAVVLAFGAAMWSQLTIGWRWAAPRGAAVPVALLLISAGGLLLAVLAILGVLPVGWTVLRQVATSDAKGLRRHAVLAAVSAGVLLAGTLHFEHGWPGTGGHHWSGQSLIPRGPAAYSWASTLSVSAYWRHPHALLRFPVAEMAWMLVSPVAIICLVTASATIVRRVQMSPAALRYEAALARVAACGMIIIAAGAFSWVISNDSGPQNLFRPGVIDAAEFVIMLLSLAVAQQAIRQLRPAARCYALP